MSFLSIPYNAGEQGVLAIQHRAGNLFLPEGEYSPPSGDPFYEWVLFLVNGNGGEGSTTFEDLSKFAWPVTGGGGVSQRDSASRFPTGQGWSNDFVGNQSVQLKTPDFTSLFAATNDLRSLPIVDIFASFTVESYVYSVGSVLYASDMWFHEFDQSSPDYQLGAYRFGRAGTPFPTSFVEMSTFNDSVVGPFNLVGDAWFHLCTQYDANTQLLRAYIDGVQCLELQVTYADDLTRQIREFNVFYLASDAPGVPENVVRGCGVRTTYGLLRYDFDGFTPDNIFYDYGPPVTIPQTGASRFYRLVVNANDGYSTATGLAQISLFESLDGTGTDLCAGLSTRVAQTGNDVLGAASNAVDGDAGTDAGSASADGNLPYGWQVVLPVAATVRSMSIRACNAVLTATPRVFTLQRSEDGMIWADCITVQNSATWTANELRTFNINEPSESLTVSPHLYWRVDQIVTVGDPNFRVSELWILQDFLQLTNYTAYSSSVPLNDGSIANLADNVLTTFGEKSNVVASGLQLNWTFADPVTVNGIRLAGYDNALNYPVSLRLSYSDNGVDFTVAASLTGLVYPGNFTYSDVYNLTF